MGLRKPKKPVTKSEVLHMLNEHYKLSHIRREPSYKRPGDFVFYGTKDGQELYMFQSELLAEIRKKRGDE